jgi:multidrug efflux pump subunit AcrA (membrane-fusion protein)
VQAEMLISEWGVGRIKVGQKVRLMYDAFPYQRYGVRFGTVRWISPAKAKVQETQSFRALVEAGDEAVVVEGEPRRLLPGMSGRAEIVVGRRSLISYAFEPIRQLKENISHGQGD